MGLTICPNPESAAIKVADAIEKAIRANPRLKLGLATGRTPAKAYQELVRRFHQQPDLSYRYITTFNTDEFLGLPLEDTRSSRYFMNRHFFKLCDVSLERTHVPRGDAVDVDQECKAYESLIRAQGGLDLLVLGLGHNGHVGFNEPGSPVTSRTRVVEFTESTMAALSDGHRFSSIDQTPSGAITMGLATIREAKEVLLIATGIGKADAVHRMVDSRKTAQVPASQLLDHPNLRILVDRDAAIDLKHPAHLPDGDPLDG